MVGRLHLNFIRIDNGLKFPGTFGETKMLIKNQENVNNMEPNILYDFSDPNLPLLDFVFVKDYVVFMQVTFADHHNKSYSDHQKAFEHLGLEEEM